jgi:hypothetical protein
LGFSKSNSLSVHPCCNLPLPPTPPPIQFFHPSFFLKFLRNSVQ